MHRDVCHTKARGDQVAIICVSSRLRLSLTCVGVLVCWCACVCVCVRVQYIGYQGGGVRDVCHA